MASAREIGVLRAIGAHNQIVSKLVIIKGITIGLLSFCLGGVLSLPITSLLSNVISLSIFGSPAECIVTAQDFGIWLGLALLLSTGASLLPARNATQLSIREVSEREMERIFELSRLRDREPGLGLQQETALGFPDREIEFHGRQVS